MFLFTHSSWQLRSRQARQTSAASPARANRTRGQGTQTRRSYTMYIFNVHCLWNRHRMQGDRRAPVIRGCFIDRSRPATGVDAGRPTSTPRMICCRPFPMATRSTALCLRGRHAMQPLSRVLVWNGSVMPLAQRRPLLTVHLSVRQAVHPSGPPPVSARTCIRLLLLRPPAGPPARPPWNWLTWQR